MRFQNVLPTMRVCETDLCLARGMRCQQWGLVEQTFVWLRVLVLEERPPANNASWWSRPLSDSGHVLPFLRIVVQTFVCFWLGIDNSRDSTPPVP